MAAPIVEKSKTANAGRFSYNYASLADTLRVVHELFDPIEIKNDQIVMDWPWEDGSVRPTLVMVTQWRHVPEGDGRPDPNEGWSEPSGHVRVRSAGGNSPAQADGIGISYAKRYSIQLTFGIAADDTDEMPNVPQQQERQPKPSTTQQSQSINALFHSLGVTDRLQACTLYLAALAGQPIEKASDLNDIQAETVIKYLTKQMNAIAQQRAQAAKEGQQQ
ncbi:ERF family protein [Bifidobacterium oedipodis]|uniref:Uncharacterized protein n=1 Tax=Bifidobacterium oedipodis TaxID=2675322 RepID=A0A7Y0EP99_9BIFI|nr:ERF family protein [Bifidobacterium sp. DSM 109957]NMM93935.1 hypothetical protein [Bifidobacterium sp. DSM 109957]